MDKFATHQPPLLAACLIAARRMPGCVFVELGCGYYSTPLMQLVAAHNQAMYVGWSSNSEWRSKFKGVESIPSGGENTWAVGLDHPEIPHTCGVILLDNEEFIRDRMKRIPHLIHNTLFLVCHDVGEIQPDQPGIPGYPSLKFTAYGNPPTLVLSRDESAIAELRELLGFTVDL